MKIVVVCGMGLGSSHYLLTEIIKILKEIELEAEVENCDLFSASDRGADVYIGADYIMHLLDTPHLKIGLADVLDHEALKKHLEHLKE